MTGSAVDRYSPSGYVHARPQHHPIRGFSRMTRRTVTRAAVALSVAIATIGASAAPAWAGLTWR